MNQTQKHVSTIEINTTGISNVTFDASNLFVLEQGVIESIEVNFVFIIPMFPLFLETFSLDRDNSSCTVSIQCAIQLAIEYSYIITYHFYPDCTANPYTSNVKTDTAPVVNICSPELEQNVEIVVIWGSDPQNNPDFLQFTASIYYDDPPYFPDIPASKVLPAPDLSQPIIISIDGSNTPESFNELLLFANNNLSPLKLTASGVMANGTEMIWGPFYFNPADTASLSFSKNYQFASITIDPKIVDWKINAGYLSLVKIDLLITAVYYLSQKTLCKMPLGKVTLSTLWDPQKQKAPTIFYKISNLPVDYSDISFDWTATYVYKSAVEYTSGTQQGIVLVLPVATPLVF